MTRKDMYETFQEAITVFFVSAGPALGATIAVVWLVGLGLGLLAVITR